jgi:hypothetical protein
MCTDTTMDVTKESRSKGTGLAMDHRYPVRCIDLTIYRERVWCVCFSGIIFKYGILGYDQCVIPITFQRGGSVFFFFSNEPKVSLSPSTLRYWCYWYWFHMTDRIPSNFYIRSIIIIIMMMILLLFLLLIGRMCRRRHRSRW